MAFGAFTMALPLPATAQAQDQPEVRMEIEATMQVSNNPFLIADENRVTGALEVVGRPRANWNIAPGTRLDFTGEVGIRQYHRLYGNFLTGLADLQLRHRHNEYLTIVGRAVYRRDLISDALTDSTDFATDAQGIRETIDARTSMIWNTNSRTTIEGDGGWRMLRYPGSTVLDRTNAYDLGVSAQRRLTERTTVGARFHMTTSHSGDERSSTKLLNATADYRFSEYWRGGIQLGVEWSLLNTQLTAVRESRARFNGGASLCYETSRQSACMRSAVRSEVSGFGGLQREVSIGGAYRNRLTEYGVLNIEGDYRRARLPVYPVSARVFRLTATYEQRLARNLYFTPGVAYLQRSRLAGEGARAFVFQLGLTLRGASR